MTLSGKQVHMVAFDRGITYPMVWSKTEGQGRVAHIAPVVPWQYGILSRINDFSSRQ